MKSFVRNSVAVAGLIAALSGAAAHALPESFHDFGQPAADGAFQRVIKITPETKSIGVYSMEIVKFADEQTGKSFVWNFNNFHEENYPLADIAPAGTLGGQAVQVYVWDNTARNSQP